MQCTQFHQVRHDPRSFPPAREAAAPIIANMNRFLGIAACLLWGLWFGGIVTLFLCVRTLFATRRPIAGQAASALFASFATYQLILACAAIVLIAIWWWLSRSWGKVAMLVMMVLAAAAAWAISASLIPRMEALRLADLAASPQFKRLHGISMTLFTTEAVLLLVAGIVLATEMGRRLTARRVGRSASPRRTWL